MANILLITRGTRGDIIGCVAIARALQNRGHKVVLLTNSFYAELAKEAGLEFIALDTKEQFNQLIEDGHLLNNPTGISTFFERNILNSVISDYEIVKSKFIPNQTIIVTRHLSALGAVLASEKLNIPLVQLFLHAASVVTIPILAEICASSLASNINSLRKQVGLTTISDWETWLKYSHNNIMSWPEWFATPEKSWPVKVNPIGFLTDEFTEGGTIPEEVERILSEDKDKPILINAGTGKFLSDKFYSSSIAACQKLGYRAIVVTPYDEFVPKNLPKGVYHFKYLPFAKLMYRVKAVIHHGGTAILARAIDAGIPQLALAFGAERPDTATRLEKLGGAKYLSAPHWHADEIAQALQYLLSSDSVANRCQELKKLQKAHSNTDVCETIEKTLATHQANQANSVIENRIEQVNQLSADKQALLALLLSKKQSNATTENISNLAKTSKDSLAIQQNPQLIENIVVAATFTAQPIAVALDFWMKKLDISAKVEFVPYNQIFQQLIDKNSLISNNKNGFNILLVRIEDFYQANQEYSNDWSNPAVNTGIENNLRSLLEILTLTVQKSALPYLFVLCPSSPSNLNSLLIHPFLAKMQDLILEKLQNINGIYLTTPQEINSYYPVIDYYDQQSDKAAHIPYSPLFFTALGTILARRIYKIKSKPRKVIVLDCDQTLWQGVCGEDGVLGVKIDSPYKALQHFVLSQYHQGMLICLCSKNNEEDVLEVFNKHPEMVLKLEHIVAWRINWQHKSENIYSLTQELKLGLDSFIFIDDSSLECAQIESLHPEVLTLLLDTNKIPRFLNHIWDFDHLKLTREDKRRSILYKENLARELLSQQTTSLKEFLAQLNLQVTIDPMKPEQVNRVAQLTQRTNQFNLTAIIRNDSEVEKLSQQTGFQILVVEAKDRFGDYGLVGVIIVELGKEALQVDTFLLSCRALGRGVEYIMAAKLGEIATLNQLSYVDIVYHETSKNKPAKEFLFTAIAQYKQEVRENILFKVPANFIYNLAYNPTETLNKTKEKLTFNNNEKVLANSHLLLDIANNFSTPEEILAAIQAQKAIRPNISTEFLAPQSEVEKRVAQIWLEALGLKEIGLNDNFFDLGGHSFLAAQIASRLSKEFNFEVPILAFFEKPTIATLAKLISQQSNNLNQKPQAKDSYLDESIAMANRRKNKLKQRNFQ